MAPKVTSSSNRAGRKPAKPPVVTTSKGRGNRSSVSTAKVSSGSNGKPPAAGARVTNASQRTNTGSARVTGSSRPALPPGQRGGALATSTKPPTARPQLPGTKPPARLPGGTGGADSVRGSGVRTGQPGATRPALPAAKPPTTAKPPTPAVKPPTAAALRNAGALGRAAGAIGAAGAIPGQVMNVVGGFQRLANHPFITKMGSGEAPKGDRRTNRPGGSRTGRGGTTSDATPTRQGPPVPARLRNAPTPPVLPAAVTRASSGGGSTPSRSGSTPSRSGSTSPARTASAAPTAPSEQRVSASTANRKSGNYGTSKTNNKLMEGLTARMKDREDKAQASSASKLTNKFNTESNFSGEKVDGSKVDTKAKMSSTTSEYDKKKRRYGG